VPSRCWIDRRAVVELIAETRRFRLRETGGALLGWREGDQSVIARILGPGPDAVHRRHSFEPDAAWQTARGAEIYLASGRTIAFLGDWHTHPLGPPIPSDQDRRTAIELAADPACRTPTPLSAIVGYSTWRPTRRSPRLVVFELHDELLVPIEATVIDALGGGINSDPERLQTRSDNPYPKVRRRTQGIASTRRRRGSRTPEVHMPTAHDKPKPDPTPHGPKYTLNIEGVDYDWDSETITVAEIRDLAGIPADQAVMEVDLEDNSELTLAEDAVVTLKPGKGFSKKVKFQRG
jgi:integrative and conjugative element protein (TIGR02256 family)